MTSNNAATWDPGNDLDDEFAADLAAEHDFAAAAQAPDITAADEPPPGPYFASVYEFVEQHLVLVYARNVNKPGRRWCKKWWAHHEAMSRLEALWRAYEQMRTDPGSAMSSWWLDHADRQMAVLLDPEGPFDGCSAEFDRHEPAADYLPVEPMTDEFLRELMSGNYSEGN